MPFSVCVTVEKRALNNRISNLDKNKKVKPIKLGLHKGTT